MRPHVLSIEVSRFVAQGSSPVAGVHVSTSACGSSRQTKVKAKKGRKEDEAPERCGGLWKDESRTSLEQAEETGLPEIGLPEEIEEQTGQQKAVSHRVRPQASACGAGAQPAAASQAAQRARSASFSNPVVAGGPRAIHTPHSASYDLKTNAQFQSVRRTLAAGMVCSIRDRSLHRRNVTECYKKIKKVWPCYNPGSSIEAKPKKRNEPNLILVFNKYPKRKPNSTSRGDGNSKIPKATIVDEMQPV